MAEIVRFRRLKRAAPSLLPGRATRRYRGGLLTLMALVFVLAAGLGSLALRPLEPPVERVRPGGDTVVARFALCSGGARVTCVVDGDTFWLDGTKIRIADIDTPEVASPRCAAEQALGNRATNRLRRLLNAGPFSLDRIEPATDIYGRQLRVVSRNGASLGGVLVDEGLARWWDGARRGWCYTNGGDH